MTYTSVLIFISFKCINIIIQVHEGWSNASIFYHQIWGEIFFTSSIPKHFLTLNLSSSSLFLTLHCNYFSHLVFQITHITLQLYQSFSFSNYSHYITLELFQSFSFQITHITLQLYQSFSFSNYSHYITLQLFQSFSFHILPSFFSGRSRHLSRKSRRIFERGRRMRASHRPESRWKLQFNFGIGTRRQVARSRLPSSLDGEEEAPDSRHSRRSHRTALRLSVLRSSLVWPNGDPFQHRLRRLWRVLEQRQSDQGKLESWRGLRRLRRKKQLLEQRKSFGREFRCYCLSQNWRLVRKNFSSSLW